MTAAANHIILAKNSLLVGGFVFQFGENHKQRK